MSQQASDSMDEGPLTAQRPHRPSDDDEEVYFEGSPLYRAQLARIFGWGLVGLVLLALPVASFYLNWMWPLWMHAICIVLALPALILPALITRTIRYRITNYRIDYERGLLTKRIDTLELWHVDDISFEQGLIDRMLGVGTIHVVSDDRTTPRLDLHGIPRPRPLFDALKERVIAVKRQRGVIKMDMG